MNWINPVLKKEWKTGIRSIKLAAACFSVNLFLTVIGLVIFSLIFQEEISYGGIYYRHILTGYMLLEGLETIILFFTVPVFSAGIISVEQEEHTLLPLFLSGMGNFRILFGKFFYCISGIILLTISTFPVIAVMSLLGGISVGDFICFAAYILAMSVFLSSISLFYSVIANKTNSAYMLTYGTLVFLLFGSVFAAGLISKIHNPIADCIGKILLMINPGTTLFSIIESQFGTPEKLKFLDALFGNKSEQMAKHWSLYSVLLWILLSAALLTAAGIVLGRKGKREKNQL